MLNRILAKGAVLALAASLLIPAASAAASSPQPAAASTTTTLAGARPGVPTTGAGGSMSPSVLTAASAGLNWVDGGVNSNAWYCNFDAFNPCSSYGWINAWTGYLPMTDAYGAVTGQYPQAGDTYYMHVVLGMVGNPAAGGDVPIIYVYLPDNTSLAIDASHPMYCFMNGVTYTGSVGTCASGGPNQVGQAELPSYGTWEVQFPVRSTGALNGITYPNSYVRNINQYAIASFTSGADQYDKAPVYVAPFAPPDTTITSSPAASTSSTSASFSFTATMASADFSCRLDGGAWGACTSPKTYAALAAGSHTFQVASYDAGIDGGGYVWWNHVDPAPASYTWTIASATPPSYSLNASTYSVNEGAGSLAITVKRAGSTAASSSVTLSTGSGTATSGADFTAVNQTVNFAIGATSAVVNVPILNDATAESAETFSVALSSPSAGSSLGAPSSATVTIADNETPTFNLAATSATVSEGAGSLVVTVKRSGSTAASNTVVIKTAGGTATSGSDFTAVSKTLTFGAGVSSLNVTLPITQDVAAEGAESLTVGLSSPSSGTVLGTQRSETVTIADDETTPTFYLSSTSATVSEGAGSLVVTVKRSGSTAASNTVVIKTAGGTATSGSDFTAVSKTLTFGAGVSSLNVTLPITQDVAAEGAESLTVGLSSPSSGTVLGTQRSETVTIADDETTPTFYLSSTSATVSEGAGSLVVTVKRSGSTAASNTVVIKTAGGTATSGSDFTAVNQTLTFGAGVTSVNVAVPIVNDALNEGDEGFSLSLSTPSAGTAVGTQKSETVVIADNETTPVFFLSGVSPSVRRARVRSRSPSSAPARPPRATRWSSRLPGGRQPRAPTSPRSARPSRSPQASQA